MNLSDVREYYGKSSGILSLINVIFLLVISGIGIYIADIINTSSEADDFSLFSLYTVFIIGIFLIVLFFIAGCMGGKKGYEGAMAFRKILSVIAIIIGTLSLIVYVRTTVLTFDEWDGYTTAIYSIVTAASILTICYSIAIFILSYKGNGYYDNKKLAKDIPDNMSLEGNKKKYMFFINISYTILSISIFLLALYFSKETQSISILGAKENSKYADWFNIIFVIGIITSFIVLLSGVILLLSKIKKMYFVNSIAYVINTVSHLLFSILTVTIIIKSLIKSQDADIAYAVFAIMLVIISGALAIKSILIAKNN